VPTHHKEFVNKLTTGKDLSESEAYKLGCTLLNGELDTAAMVECLTLMHIKGESVSEILGFVQAMRAHMTPLSFSQRPLIDVCGTGGSLPNRFNASTCAALVLGHLGFAVAKHGNRGSKKANGSFDFLDALQIPYALTEVEHQNRLNQYGCTFLFARRYHPAVRHVAEARAQLKTRSIFNLIGPFCNPASPTVQIIGVPTKSLAKTLLTVAKSLNYHTFAVITSDIGLDECSTVGTSTITKLSNGKHQTIHIDPKTYGIHHTLEDMTVNDSALASDNAKAFTDMLKNRDPNHPLATFIALNAAVIMHIINASIPIESAMDQAKQALFSLALK
jgi:anthranilate phosphoribosyltransferase